MEKDLSAGQAGEFRDAEEDALAEAGAELSPQRPLSLRLGLIDMSLPAVLVALDAISEFYIRLEVSMSETRGPDDKPRSGIAALASELAIKSARLRAALARNEPDAGEA